MRRGQRLGVVATDQRARVARRELALLQQRANRRRQLQQTQRVGEVAAALADDLGQLLLGVAEALDQVAVAGRLLDGVEIGALHVLDDGELERLLIAQIAHDHRHLMQAGPLRRAPAPFAGDDLVAAALAIRARDDRLHAGPCWRIEFGKLGQLAIVGSPCAGWTRRRAAGRSTAGAARPAPAAAAQRCGVSPISDARPRPSRPFWMGIAMAVPSS